ncbi:hypothetical protein [Methanococcus maripaludis]|uniref:tRNA(Ile2) C34 agmatinyltransferase TiaS n=1 Tax=Methanococcus maripaludis TaxID=39152 RepID=A0A7J9PFK6_METMI|nr:hypothetical protein [Methanococcus maripaludis]MBA2861921.1 tRNA(Ile2) C34 agmatinyltransferase TiaS [Methanococcus maripaludis]
MEFKSEISKYTIINLDKLKTNKTKCPKCGKEFNSVGKKIICPECKYIFKVAD